MHGDEKKNRIQSCTLSIAVIGVIAAAALNGSCVFDSKTMLCEKTGLRCKPGQVCAPAQDVCVDIGGCGDGVIDTDEVCDDGNILDDDGCRSDCKSDEACGNGVVDEKKGESCDDGALNGTLDSACGVDCVLAGCGNRIVDLNEECDPGQLDSAGCNSNSKMNGPDKAHCQYSRCGDGYVNMAAEEECDDGPMPSGRCNSPTFCKLSRCGDGFYNQTAGEECDTVVDTRACNGGNTGNVNIDCHAPRCGDGYANQAAAEACDDGNADICGTCIECAGFAKSITNTVTALDATHFAPDDAFTISDGLIDVKFVYNSTLPPVPGVVDISIASNDSAEQIAQKTRDAINGHVALRVTAQISTINANIVDLTADQLGVGKLTVQAVQPASAGLSIGNPTAALGDACADTIGCVTNMDCKSYFCSNGVCRAPMP